MGKILTLRETATSQTWAKFIKNETAEELENGLRCLFALTGPSNATRARICRTDNAKSFVSLHNNQSLTDIGVTIDLSNAQNKNGNPVAEKNNREVQDAILSITPAGGQISEVELSQAISALNSRPRWTGMSASELWTGRDMSTGTDLKFSQQDIIKRQQSRRAAKHLRPNLPSKEFAVGDIVFSNSDRSKLKARDKLLVREYLGNGQYRLDRMCGKSHYMTSTIKPDYDLYMVETENNTSPTEIVKSVTWDNNETIINNEIESPTPERTAKTDETTSLRSRPTTRASSIQKRSHTAPPHEKTYSPSPRASCHVQPQTGALYPGQTPIRVRVPHPPHLRAEHIRGGPKHRWGTTSTCPKQPRGS